MGAAWAAGASGVIGWRWIVFGGLLILSGRCVRRYRLALDSVWGATHSQRQRELDSNYGVNLPLGFVNLLPTIRYPRFADSDF